MVIPVMVEFGFLPHGGKEATGRMMYHFAENYPGDLLGANRLPFSVWYSRVTKIPYRSDDELFASEPNRIIELVARPSYLLSGSMFAGLDCKKKSILCGAWASANDCPFYFLAVSEKPNREIHHVIPLIDYDGKGLAMLDPTMPGYSLGQKLPITYAEVLPR